MSRPGAAALVRLVLMAGVAAWLVWRVLAAPAGAPAVAARGSAGTSSGESGEWRAARAAPAPSGEVLGAGVRLIGADGHAHELAEFQGRSVVVAFVYTRCPSVCPRLTHELVGFARATARQPEPPHIVLLSLDPAYDTPPVLKAFAREHQLDPARFTLLAPPPSALPALARALGLAWRAEGGGIAHSAVVAVLGPDGRVRERRVGLGSSAEVVALWARAGAGAGR